MHARLPWSDEFRAASASRNAPNTTVDQPRSSTSSGRSETAKPGPSGLKTPATEPTYDQHTALSHPEIDLTPSTNPDAASQRKVPAPLQLQQQQLGKSGSAAVAHHALSPRHGRFPSGGSGTPTQYSNQATAGETGSGASTPSSVAYVPIDEALERVSRRLRRKAGSTRSLGGSDDESARTSPLHSARVSAELGRSGGSRGSPERGAEDGAGGAGKAEPGSAEPEELDGDAAGEEDEHDVYLTYDPARGLDHSKYAVLPNDWPYCVPYGVRHFCVWSRVPIAHPELVGYDRAAWRHIEEEGLAGFTGVLPSFSVDNSADSLINDGPGRSGPADPHAQGGWYAVDLEYSGAELRRWAGVEFETPGGQKVGEMVRGLWDERGWETIWFVNPARLQSVPGLAHFHVFARRKTPEEIDVSEKVFGPPGSKRRIAIRAGAGNGSALKDGLDGKETPQELKVADKASAHDREENRRQGSFAEPAPSPALDDSEASKPLTVTA